MPSIRRWVVTAVLCSVAPLAAQAGPDARATAQREDLAAFERDFLAVDRAYTPEARAAAERRLATLASEAGKRSDVAFVLALAQVVALADNGHTLMVSRGRVAGMARVGLRLAPFGRDFHVVRATTGNATLLGAQVLAINGVPIAQVRDSAHSLVGGIAAWRDRMTPAFLESPGQLHAMGLGRSATEATYRVLLSDGATRDVVLGVDTTRSATDRQGMAAVLNPETSAGWQSLLPPSSAPWSLQEFTSTMRRRDAPELDAMVIQLRANVNGAQPIATFLNESDSIRKSAGRSNVVLDMRMNGGGNLQLTRDWMQSIVSRLPADGKVVVLTSPWTFSAAISSVGYLKQAGGARVVLVGEAPGDRMNFFAEGRPATLPNSGAMFLTATERHDYATGCRGYSDCHRPVASFPIAVPDLEPEIAAPWLLESYRVGRDPGMEAVAQILGRR